MTTFGDQRSALAAWKLRELPGGLKVVLSVFVLLLAAGHVAGVANHYFVYGDSDGRPGLSYEDLHMALSGKVLLPPDASITTTILWQQVHGDMRGYFRTDGDFAVVEAWLEAGAHETTYDWPWTFHDSRPVPLPAPQVVGDEVNAQKLAVSRAPASIFRDTCVRCHGPGGERATAPLNTFAAVRSQLEPPPPPDTGAPPTLARLTSVTHAHLLTVPLLALIVAGLFYLADWPPSSPPARGVMTALPLIAFALDAALAWAVRTSDLFVVPMLAARLVFLLGIALQIVGILGGVWQPATGAARDESNKTG